MAKGKLISKAAVKPKTKDFVIAITAWLFAGADLILAYIGADPWWIASIGASLAPVITLEQIWLKESETE
jgi:hypothetical protein